MALAGPTGSRGGLSSGSPPGPGRHNVGGSDCTDGTRGTHMNRYGRLALTALAALIGAGLLAGAKVDKTPQTAPGAADPYLWLEDVHGAKALKWVRAQNAKSTAVLQADPDYQRDYDAILKVLDATDRIPYGELDHQYVFNFWQDAQHPKGIWRSTSIADHANAAAAGDLLLDVDQL